MNKLIFKRIVAFYIDSIITTIISLFLWYCFDDLLFGVHEDYFWQQTVGMYQLVIFPIYLLVLEYTIETTIGKFFFNLIVVYSNNEKNFKKSFLRTICKMIPFDLISFIFDKDNKLWHEKLSDTDVQEKKQMNAIL